MRRSVRQRLWRASASTTALIISLLAFFDKTAKNLPEKLALVAILLLAMLLIGAMDDYRRLRMLQQTLSFALIFSLGVGIYGLPNRLAVTSVQSTNTFEAAINGTNTTISNRILTGFSASDKLLLIFAHEAKSRSVGLYCNHSLSG